MTEIRQHSLNQKGVDREELPVDVLLVGGGAANLACAIHLQRLLAAQRRVRLNRFDDLLALAQAARGPGRRVYDVHVPDQPSMSRSASRSAATASAMAEGVP